MNEEAAPPWYAAPWQVRHLELTGGLPDLDIAPDRKGMYLVFWREGAPLGHVELPAERFPLRAGHVRDLAASAIAPAVVAARCGIVRDGVERPGAASVKVPPDAYPCLLTTGLRSPEGMPESPPLSRPRLSVVVCTRDRPADLVPCLTSLRSLTLPPDEVIVVDNGTDPAASAAVRQAVSDLPGGRYVREARPGLSVARNAGVRAATGDVIAFTDDDVTVHPDWTRRLLSAFGDDPEALAVTGLVLPEALESEAQIVFEKGIGGFGQGYVPIRFDRRFFDAHRRRGIPVWRIGAGANMAFRREAFARLGLFDERLGAGAAGCSEDSEMWYRVLAEGSVCRYEPAAVVFHRHRTEMEALYSQAFQYMRGHVAALLAQWERYGHTGNLRRAFFLLPLHFAREAVVLLLRYPGRETPADRRLFRAQVCGALSGAPAYVRYRLRPERRRPRPGAAWLRNRRGMAPPSLVEE